MIRLNSIGAAVFALAALALPTFAMTHSAPEKLTHLDTRGQLQDVNLAEVVATAQAAANDGDGIPTAWCGEDRTTDNTANAVFPASKAQFKVVYAFAADRQNRFAGWRDAIQANTAIVQRFLSAQGGGTKAIRFDMGTSCGPQYVDIQIVPLPGPRSSYADNFGAISSAVSRALGATTSTPRNAIVIADGLAGGTQEYGLGETIMGSSGEKPGATNVHNRGGLTSILFTKDGAAAPVASRWGWWPEGFLHEMTHNLGAVQWGAPHSTQPRGGSAPNYGHCWQGADVMCYVEDAGAAHGMQIDCAGLPGAIPQNYDCGRDDYFNPAPTPGSYLATHWNTYDSAFLAPCGEIAPACGGGANWVPQAPAATAPPTVNGGLRRGVKVTAGVGAWTNTPDELRLPVAASGRGRLGGHRLRDRRQLPDHQRRPRPPPARDGRGHQPGRLRLRCVEPDGPGRRRRRQPRRLTDVQEGQEVRGQGQDLDQEEEGLEKEGQAEAEEEEGPGLGARTRQPASPAACANA